MHYFDLIFLVVLFVVQPVHGAFSSRKLSKAIETGVPVDRISMFRETMVTQWIALLVLGVF